VRPPRPVLAPDPDPDPDATSALMDTIKEIDATTFEVPRAVVEKVLANPMIIAKGARVVPSIKDGKPNGMKLYAIRPSSGWAKVGFVNGDTIHAVNGHDVSSADKALEVYTMLRSASELRVEITRRGKPGMLTIKIVK
jgi:general secretion pathway protein C